MDFLLFYNSAPGVSRHESGIKTQLGPSALSNNLFFVCSFPDWENKATVVLRSLSSSSSSPLLFLAPTDCDTVRVKTLSPSASSTSWRSGGRAGSGSNGTSPRGPRSTGCHSRTGCKLTCHHPDPCPSSCGCRARCPYLEWCCPGRSRRNLRWTCGWWRAPRWPDPAPSLLHTETVDECMQFSLGVKRCRQWAKAKRLQWMHVTYLKGRPCRDQGSWKKTALYADPVKKQILCALNSFLSVSTMSVYSTHNSC